MQLMCPTSHGFAFQLASTARHWELKSPKQFLLKVTLLRAQQVLPGGQEFLGRSQKHHVETSQNGPQPAQLPKSYAVLTYASRRTELFSPPCHKPSFASFATEIQRKPTREAWREGTRQAPSAWRRRHPRALTARAQTVASLRFQAAWWFLARREHAPGQGPRVGSGLTYPHGCLPRGLRSRGSPARPPPYSPPHPWDHPQQH